MYNYDLDIYALLFVVAILVAAFFMYVQTEKSKPIVLLKSLFTNSIIKIKGGQMNLTMNPGQYAVVQGVFKNRRAEPTTVQPGTVRFKLLDSNGEPVPESKATVTQLPGDETQCRVETTAGASPEARELWNLVMIGDADRDEDEEREISGSILGIVYESLEASEVSASVITEPTDL